LQKNSSEANKVSIHHSLAETEPPGGETKRVNVFRVTLADRSASLFQARCVSNRLYLPLLTCRVKATAACVESARQKRNHHRQQQSLPCNVNISQLFCLLLSGNSIHRESFVGVCVVLFPRCSFPVANALEFKRNWNKIRREHVKWRLQPTLTFEVHAEKRSSS